jgi:hypothetical protein
MSRVVSYLQKLRSEKHGGPLCKLFGFSDDPSNLPVYTTFELVSNGWASTLPRERESQTVLPLFDLECWWCYNRTHSTQGEKHE